MKGTAKSRFEGMISIYCKKFGIDRETLKRRWRQNGLIVFSTNELNDRQKEEISDALWTSIINNVE